MIAWEVWHNGQHLCTAGGEDINLLLGIIRWTEDTSDVEVSGYAQYEERTFANVEFRVGDEILLKLKDVGEQDLSRPVRIEDLRNLPMYEPVPSVRDEPQS